MIVDDSRQMLPVVEKRGSGVQGSRVVSIVVSVRLVSHFVALGSVDDVVELSVGTGDRLDLKVKISSHSMNETIVVVEHGSGCSHRRIQ
jgi:hypothetical protein